MSGFLSGCKPQIKKVKEPCANLKLRRKLKLNEYTENPPLRRSSYLTDDEGPIPQIDGNNTTNVGKEKLADIVPEMHGNEDEEDKENTPAADTVVDTVCSRLSELQLKPKLPIRTSISESLFNTTQESPKDTVVDSINESKVLQELEVRLSSKKKLFTDTVEDLLQSDEEIDSSIKLEPAVAANMDVSMDSDEVISVLDSDEEEQESNLGQPPIVTTSDSFVNCSTSMQTLDDFFNNPPSVPSKQAVVTHSLIQKFKNRELVEMEAVEEIINNSMHESEKELDDTVSDHEDIEIGPTDESDNVIDLTRDDNSPAPKDKCERNSLHDRIKSVSTPISITVGTQTPTETTQKKKNFANINIKFDLKISIRERSATSEETDTNSTVSSESSNLSVKESHLKALPQSPIFERKSSAKTMPPEPKHSESDDMVPVRDCDAYHSPRKPVIDKQMQLMLDEMYSDAWKTPEVLKKFDIRKSIAANNFESFVGSLSKDLESTRISSPKTERPARKHVTNIIKPISSVSKKEATKKTDLRNFLSVPKVFSSSDKNNRLPSGKKTVTIAEKDTRKNDLSQSSLSTQKTPVQKSLSNVTMTRTPLHLLCDPDTETESDYSGDEDFNPDDTWNASSDEEYKSEKDRIKKRQSVKLEADQMIFVIDDSPIDILKKYMYQPKPQIESTPAKPSRRKLFTPEYLNDYEDVVEEIKPKTPVKPQRVKVPSPKETKIPKKTPAKSVRINDSAVSARDMLKRFSNYSFLKSLDAEANKMLCDKEAIYYRENYKSKKHELAEKLFKLYNEKVFELKLKDVPIKWNKKLLTTGGRCNNSRRLNVRNSLIELSDKVLTSADRLRCTLIHEMCHAAAWILNGENGHGATWKSWTSKANSVFPELPKITVCHSYVIEYKYTYLCVNCRARSQAHTKSKKVEEIRCSLCKGAIELYENKKKADGTLELVPVQKREPTAFAKFVKQKFKQVKTNSMSHKQVMQILSAEFAALSVEEKAQL